MREESASLEVTILGGGTMSTNHVHADEEAKPPGIESGANGSDSPAVVWMLPPLPWPIEPEKNELEQESAYYHEHLPEWSEQEGQHILIHGQEHFGFFPTRNAALEEGFRRFGHVPILVKQIQRDEKPRPMMWVML
jgi:hypothetical protein